jgi:hypothetical protein
MQANAPAGWRINLWLDLLLGAVARMAVLILVLAGQVPKAIFKQFLITILSIPINQATVASSTVTIHASATQGGTLEAGAQIVIDGVGFVTTADTTVAAAGSTSVPVQAVLAGTAGSGLSGVSVQLSAPSVTWVETVTLDAPTTGGVDGETDDEFVNRGADEIPTLSPKMIHVDDVAPILRGDPEVHRVLVLKGFVPPSTTGVAGAVTVAPMNATGGSISSPGKTRVETTIEAGRILQLDAHVIDPTPNAIDVAFTAKCDADQDPVVVAAAAEQAILEFLSPLGWGIPSGGQPTEWVNEPTVVRNDLFGVLYNVPGIRHVSALTLALHGNTKATADLTMTGAAPVPTTTLADILSTVTT